VRKRSAPILAGLLALAVAAPPALAADVRRIEAVGVVPLRAGKQGSALDEAIQAALVEAVSRVAQSFVDEAEPSEQGEVDLKEILGKRMVPYTSRFRILDDQGERPAMFAEDSGVRSEYVVVVEVHVDADRVQERLIEAGVLQRADEAGKTSRIALEARGVWQYGAYEALRQLIVQHAGARTAIPRGFKRGVVLLDVELAEASADATDLAESLVEQQSDELRIRPVEVDARRLVVRVEWTPPSDAAPGPVGTQR
jgi:hypothetical protein